jgi:TRAP-type C4-dicarboxylate transport system permease large subunit
MSFAQAAHNYSQSRHQHISRLFCDRDLSSFSWLITVGRVSQAIAEGMLNLSQNPFMIVTLINLLLLFWEYF